ncbi:ABC transporter substrate-binding protein [Pyrococcus yayanosii]|uniref:Iron III ABC transporter, ATP-binding protein n=1 Tax=Pyrococcus yayanosii (strain CH1 / JCM 16557) TaxID=529709 RepID=F8AG95_PYRYC|nr:ABC transporter substrate-binding protein [Pyrococcus yayanosii]AEH23931.1 iron III ABC transporter, ATP-binding protein [Pyrococcus yayanosii CH1]
MRKGLLVGLLMAIVILSGCIGSNTTTAPAQMQTVTSRETITVTQTVTETYTPTNYPITITDSLGRKVKIEKEPQRIVSLAPSITEMLYFIGALDKVVGVTQFDDFPPGVQEGRTVIGGFSDPNIEVIASLSPDLIIGTSMHIQYLEQLEKIAPVIIIEPKNIDEIYEWTITLGKVVNREDEAKGVVNYMKAIVESVETKVNGTERPRVLFISWWNPIYVPGGDTFQGALIEMAGGRNIFHDVSGWKQVSVEEIIARDPEVIILSAHAGVTPEDLCNSPLAQTTAVREGRIYVVSDDNLVSRPGPRIVLGLEELARFIHPEAFGYAHGTKACAAASS